MLTKLFTAAPESILGRLNWETKGLKIDAKYFSHLHFAANTSHELQHMLQELADESEHQDLKMNKSKTKVVMENDTPIYVNNTEIEKLHLPETEKQHERPKPRQ